MELTQDAEPLALNCPKCPTRMWHHGTLPDGTRVYTCAVHGEWRLGDGALFQPDPGQKINLDH